MKKLLLIACLLCTPAYAVKICEPLEDYCTLINEDKIQYVTATDDGEYQLQVHTNKVYPFHYGRYKVLMDEDFDMLYKVLYRNGTTRLTKQQYMSKYYKAK